MAKTIMIADPIYNELKARKERDGKSFSQVIMELLEKPKTLNGLRKYVGVLKGDKEYDTVLKDARKSWKQWSKKYA